MHRPGTAVDRLVDTLASQDGPFREKELAKLAFFDELTNLPKTNLARQFVTDLMEAGERCFAVAFIDLDNFKYINDYYGHEAGDKLLQKVAQRICDGMAPTDMLARVGGDEFVLITLSPGGALVDIEAELARLSMRFKQPFFIDGFEIFSSASIGVSIYPLHGHSYEALRATADSAMYRVKEGTKGSVRIFDRSISDAATLRMENEQRLRLAIRDRKLYCAFQPQVDFRNDRIVGVEVLLRWRDANGHLQSPGQLIGLAIELGLMDEITMMVLDQVIEQIDDLNDAFGPETSISINVAAKQATDVPFMRQLAGAIARTRHAHRFLIELTEEAFLSKDTFRSQVLPMLTAAGLRVSIDDFGVGYSSLSALAEISAHELKIDRAFITDIHLKPRNQTIIKMIELLGDELDMHVIVEGVEQQEEVDYLIRHTRISCAQGYFFAKPMVLRTPRGEGPQLARRHATGNRAAAPNRGGTFAR